MSGRERYVLSEKTYDMAKERLASVLFVTGNGYMGVRGSFEEYSTLGVQGLYIRGYIDEITEICTPVPTDYYTKKYYFNEERLKEFERTECGVNVADILTVRIRIGGRPFLMHEGKLLSYERKLDLRTGVLTRSVRWRSEDGDVTDIVFERFASYADKHLYCQRVTVIPVGHDQPVEIYSGMDLRTKTNGQRATKAVERNAEGDSLFARVESGPKYAFSCMIGVDSRVAGEYARTECREEGIFAVGYRGRGRAVLEKKICLVTSRDCEGDLREYFAKVRRRSPVFYAENLRCHLKAFIPAFTRGNVRIGGDVEAGISVAFSCFQTLISACRWDNVHGVGAKGLTGEQYHQYVWWDSEIYQMPYFIYTAPETAKKLLEYRYRTLRQARENARAAGRKGARFAFCSAVTGEECVWSFCNHPFMQDHISADVAFSTLHYYDATGDKEFMEREGYELLFACLEYWLSRAERTARGYEIRRVTGPDEHHPFVDNDAYTNYLVRYVVKRGVKLYEAEGESGFDFAAIGVGEQLISGLKDLSEKMYLPVTENGYVPQFDGYFGLSRRSETTEYVLGMQMKHKGYHESQFIKQPDVMLLYTYANVGMDERCYERNFDYYEKMCECSSSLSYAPHAIACADHGRMLSFCEYLEKTANIDLKNLHGGSEEGIHSGCAAGAWYAIFRGLFGCVLKDGNLTIRPRVIPWWKQTEIRFFYKGRLLKLKLCGKILSISKQGGKSLSVNVCGNDYRLTNKKLEVRIE